jgi:hypothetical protein
MNFEVRSRRSYPPVSQAGPSNDINAGSRGSQKAPTQIPASLVQPGPRLTAATASSPRRRSAPRFRPEPVREPLPPPPKSYSPPRQPQDADRADEIAYRTQALRSQVSLTRASAIVCHCMFETASGPPHASGTSGLSNSLDTGRLPAPSMGRDARAGTRDRCLLAAATAGRAPARQ